MVVCGRFVCTCRTSACAAYLFAACSFYNVHYGLYGMLNNLRDSLKPALARMGRGFAAVNPSPDFWTCVGLVLALCSAAAYGLGPYLGQSESTEHYYGMLSHITGYGIVAGGILLLASGFFDMVDGQVARVTKKTSDRGSYLDSVSDKVAESAIFVGIAVGGMQSRGL